MRHKRRGIATNDGAMGQMMEQQSELRETIFKFNLFLI